LIILYQGGSFSLLFYLRGSKQRKIKMLTKIETTKTYWIGINENQKTDLIEAIRLAIETELQPGNECYLSNDALEALEALRLALLNV